MSSLLINPHIIETKWEIRGRDSAWKRTLVIMTDLVLDPDCEDYDPQAEAQLLDAIGDYWRKNPDKIDAVNIRSTRSG